MKLHIGTLFAGLVYLIIGLVFLAEAAGWWTFQWSDLRLIGPLALVLIGLAVLVGTMTRKSPTD
ncbi:MAG TPA: hypothetical protein VJ796_04670 [Acidimicrobiia bacterium]|nr:hypothetical protein [Acidimicrobiia bacterium]